jgi:hypothetical protein
LNRSEVKRQRLERRLQSDVVSARPVGRVKSRVTWTGHPTSVVVATLLQAIQLLVVPIANYFSTPTTRTTRNVLMKRTNVHYYYDISFSIKMMHTQNGYMALVSRCVDGGSIDLDGCRVATWSISK